MKSIFILAILTLSAFRMAAQGFPSRVYDGSPRDSAVINFGDSLFANSGAIHYSLDTGHATLWKIGTTSKLFFTAGQPQSLGIMTDTLNPYPVNANDWFTLKITTSFLNPIISFRHKLQTSAGHDGGIVEYSFDSLTWNNVVGGCFLMVPTDSFYKKTDTLVGGTPAFTGTSQWKRSRFQFFQGFPIKETGACMLKWPVYVRFRFVSDSSLDTLAGWRISNITLEKDLFSGLVESVAKYPSLDVYPNPSRDGIFYWPELVAGGAYSIVVTDITGRPMISGRYQQKLDCRDLPPGLYFYHVGNGSMEFAGKLLRE